MFGEKIMLGVATSKLDNKNRFSVPKFTLVETNEKLIMFYPEDMNDDYVELYNVNYLEKLKLLYDNLLYEDDIIKLQKVKERLDSFYNRALCESKVDKQHRFLISANTKKIEEIDSTVVVQGAGDYCKVYKNEESYKRSLKKIKSQL